MSPESEESTFTELIQELLDAIRANDLDEEMSIGQTQKVFRVMR